MEGGEYGEGVGCMKCDSSERGAFAAASGCNYVGLEYCAGRGCSFERKV